MLYKMVLSLWMKYLSETVQMKATEQDFPVVLLYYAVQDDFESVDEILNCDIHLKAAEQHRLSCGTVRFPK